MQFDQFVRRMVWRVRRRFRRAADNEPVITVEPAGPAPRPSRPSPRRPRRLLRTAFAFVATLAVLGAGYAVLVALNSQVRLAPATVPGAVDGSHGIAAVTEVLAMGVQIVAPVEDMVVVPSTRRLRELRVQAGAARVAAVYIARAGPAQGRLDPALADARAAMANPGGIDRVSARDALVRFNARLADGKATLDTGPLALAGLLRAAADACENEAADLATLAASPTLLASPAVDARVAEARGVAWGWLLVTRGALADAPAIAGALSLEATIPLDALTAIAERQPLFLFNGDPDSPWAPAHVADSSADFARAAAGARALADAVERHAG